MTSVAASDLDGLFLRLADVRVLDGHDGRSGSTLLRATLDGEPVVLKRAPVDDPVLALTGDAGGRELALWSEGTLDRLDPAVGHAVLGGGLIGGERVTVMRDLAGSVVGWDRRLSVREVEHLLNAVTTMHVTFGGRTPSICCPLEERLNLFARHRLAAVEGSPLAAVVRRGWDRLAELVDPDVWSAVEAMHTHPARLAEVLRREGTTLLHGDLWVVNLALEADRVVLLDWALATDGPPVLDFVIFLTGCASQVEMAPDELIDLVRRTGATRDPAVVDAALGWGLAELGWNKAIDATEHPDAAKRAAEQASLDWWVSRTRIALEAGLLGT